MTEVLDVAHAAARQMRAARRLREALDERQALNIAAAGHWAREAAAAKVRRLIAEHKAALDAYHVACDAIDLHPPAAAQPGLFDTPEGA